MAADLVTEALDLVVQVVGLLLQLGQGFVLSSQDSEEVLLSGVQQVLSESAGLFRLRHRAVGTVDGGVAFLFSLH